MVQRVACLGLIGMGLFPAIGVAQAQSPNGVKTLNPPGAIRAEGTWSLGTRAGAFIFVAGMQGIDPATNTLVQDSQARVVQAFLNIKTSPVRRREPAGLRAAHRLCQRSASLRADGGESASGAVGRSALSATHHDRGAAPCSTTISSRSTAFFTRR
jgi:hypothetical protein